MEFQRLLVGLADACVRRAKLVVAVAALVVVFAGVFAAGHLGISTDTDEMFAKSLPCDSGRCSSRPISRSSAICW